MVEPLTMQERDDLRHEFHRFMDANPLPVREYKGMNRFAFPAPQLAVITLLFGLAGTSYMAEGASPKNEVLYAVKRNVNEGFFKGISTFSPEWRAEVDKALLSRRFSEVEELIVKKAFADDHAARLRADIAAHTLALNEFVSGAEEDGDFEAALEVSDDLVTLLDAHNTVLFILDNLEENPHGEHVDSFISEIGEGRNHLYQRRQALSEKTVVVAPLVQAAAVANLAEKLEESTAKHERVKRSHEVSSDHVEEEIEFLIEQSENAKMGAEADLASGDMVASIRKLENAVQNMEKATIVLLSYQEAVED